MRKIDEIVIATANRGKIAEMEHLFRELPVKLRSLLEFKNISEVEETGGTFRKNAELKAAGYARQTGTTALADDSGLEIAALGNAPGVLSARFGGDIGFGAKMSLVLQEMESAIDYTRDARFVCAMALADRAGKILITVEGICEGTIAPEPRGHMGFGYDPIFIPDGFNQTFGELPDEIKCQISHRARAAAKIIRYLLGFTGTLT